MIHYSTRDEITACREFALERNRQLFEEAETLNQSAFTLLEGSELDAEQFDRYQAMRRKADLKFEEAIEHLQVVNEDFPVMPAAAANTRQMHESRA